MTDPRIGYYAAYIVPYSQLYPNPFLDPASLFLPRNIKDIFKLARYFYLTHPLVATIIYKMSEYPITKLTYQTSNEKLKKLYQEILEDKLDIHKRLIEIGITYHVYGTVLVSIVPPFKRRFIGKKSGKEYVPLVEKGQPNWYKHNNELYFRPSNEPVEIEDIPLKTTEFRLVIWDPMNVEIEYNEFIDEAQYYYTIPTDTMKKFATSPFMLERSPLPFLKAWIQSKKAVRFNPNNLVVIKRPGPPMGFNGWGVPLVVHVLQSLHYQQMLRRAQYAIAKERTLPLRYLFPPPEMISSNSPLTINLSEWKQRLEEALFKWRLNPNYIGIFPVPVQQAALSGEGKSLMLFPEINALSEEIIQGLQVPLEFVRGGLSWSGTSVSLRMLENHFLNYRHGLQTLLRKIVKIISIALEIEPIEIGLLPFKMADDLQRKQLLQALYQLQVISKHTLLEQHELDYEKEFEYIKKEMEDMGELQAIQARAQAQAQMAAQNAADYEDYLVPENMPLGPQADILMSNQLAGMLPPPEAQPLPEVKPPRRKNQSI